MTYVFVIFGVKFEEDIRVQGYSLTQHKTTKWQPFADERYMLSFTLRLLRLYIKDQTIPGNNNVVGCVCLAHLLSSR